METQVLSRENTIAFYQVMRNSSQVLSASDLFAIIKKLPHLLESQYFSPDQALSEYHYWLDRLRRSAPSDPHLQLIAGMTSGEGDDTLWNVLGKYPKGELLFFLALHQKQRERQPISKQDYKQYKNLYQRGRVDPFGSLSLFPMLSPRRNKLLPIFAFMLFALIVILFNSTLLTELESIRRLAWSEVRRNDSALAEATPTSLVVPDPTYTLASSPPASPISEDVSVTPLALDAIQPSPTSDIVATVTASPTQSVIPTATPAPFVGLVIVKDWDMGVLIYTVEENRDESNTAIYYSNSFTGMNNLLVEADSINRFPYYYRNSLLYVSSKAPSSDPCPVSDQDSAAFYILRPFALDSGLPPNDGGLRAICPTENHTRPRFVGGWYVTLCANGEICLIGTNFVGLRRFRLGEDDNGLVAATTRSASKRKITAFESGIAPGSLILTSENAIFLANVPSSEESIIPLQLVAFFEERQILDVAIGSIEEQSYILVLVQDWNGDYAFVSLNSAGQIVAEQPIPFSVVWQVSWLIPGQSVLFTARHSTETSGLERCDNGCLFMFDWGEEQLFLISSVENGARHFWVDIP